jgi:hypothetical protein
MTTETLRMTFPSRFLNRQRVIAFQWQWRARNFKVKERSGNVYENKGSVWEAAEGSGNVIENKATYAIIAGI